MLSTSYIFSAITEAPALHRPYSCRRKSHSVINENGNLLYPLSKPCGGNTCQTRFFSTSTEQTPQFVVKKPRLLKFGKYPLEGKELADAIAKHTAEFENELQIWNLVYPAKKGKLFTDSELGPRLVLPRLPGRTVNEESNKDILIRYQQALAIAYALRNFQQLGWFHCDVNGDNILLDQKPDGTWQAYLIDFGNVSRQNFNTHWTCLLSLTELPNQYRDLESFIEDVSDKIKGLQNIIRV
jgi:hypothetical protein